MRRFTIGASPGQPRLACKRDLEPPLGRRDARGAALLVGAVASIWLAGCAAPLDDGPRAAFAPAPPAPVAAIAAHQRGRASYYSDRLAGRRTAAGERYDPRALTAAHRTLPFGAVVEVVRADGRRVTVRINDRGPYARGRVIDLSRRAARDLGMLREGVIEVALRVLYVPPRRPAKRRHLAER